MSAIRRTPRRSARDGGVRRVGAWAIALLALGAALWALLRPAPQTSPPLDQIDDASRERLDALLREAERAQPEPR